MFIDFILQASEILNLPLGQLLILGMAMTKFIGNQKKYLFNIYDLLIDSSAGSA